MKTFQFDENFDDARVIEACNSANLSTVDRYPRALKGKKDPEILPIVLAGEHPFVTLDGRIVEEHNNYIPDHNPGVIVVALRRPTRTMTTRLGAYMLSEFKKRYKDWPLEDTSGIKVEINETGVKLSRLKNSEKCFVIDYSITNFENEVKNKMDMLRGLAITPP